VSEYKKKFKKDKGENCTASDLHNTLLQDLVNDIDAINGLPVQCIPTTPKPSSSRGGSKRTVIFLPDEPLEEYTVCNMVYSLTPDLHNRLCLLRGVLMALLPKTKILGSQLPDVVRVSLVLCLFVLYGVIA
jgi:hypothetical protein